MKILVAIDQSPFWTGVVEGLLKQQWLPDTQFKILTVLEPLPFSWEDFAGARWKELAHEIFDKRRHVAEQVVLDARQSVRDGVPDCIVHTDVRHGRARDEIVNAAIEWMPDKIILGAHGHSPNRFFPGSVSHAVAQHAPCSVELVRLPEVSVAEAVLVSVPGSDEIIRQKKVQPEFRAKKKRLSVLH